ncbi:hypothetical protein SERLA73DRAFT_67939 [Serpula lacrymans var. lacrymans S7.3]|uniref:CCHC-type domain-containing protein n=2 Tax=Serpula lacrymans var. lacrymans TaxID=341189 RepID=F8PFC6_SERL3|nr:uncharacterized protein SERLADRAFT_431640 [Serpula lacrymans var. lacrymans S7.9]EGO04232.1 hypothetical protein SERLA73DRAFT_67939 [Serpula lacrymans var. lacrymans S7.3]EGO30170.1 hypothetical protein SERLADRAFT_431640 [Serpula lacrymans var. lacrymans S7.9]
MSSQTPDVNTLLHNMHAQILALTMQLAKLQANPPAAAPSVEKKFNKKVEVVADPGAFEGDKAWQVITKNNYSQRSPGSSNKKSNHSHGFQPGRGTPMDIGTVQGGQMHRFTCYNCGEEGHISQKCTNGARAAQQKNNQGHQVRQLEAEKPDDWLNTLAGRLYDKIWAFFYDQQVAEMKTQGKEFRA